MPQRRDQQHINHGSRQQLPVVETLIEGDIDRGRANLIVDAMGRGSLTPHWLAELGFAAPPTELNGAPLPAIRVVESEASVRPVLERLLGMTRIVRDLKAATEEVLSLSMEGLLRVDTLLPRFFLPEHTGIRYT